MSELKSFNMPRYAGEFTMHEVYLKSEADKVIAEKEKEIARQNIEIKNAVIDLKLRDKKNDELTIAIAEKDKAIAELKADYKEACGRLQTANLIKDEQLAETRHQKWKRCLAMAKWCEERYNYLTCLENWQMSDKEYQQVIGDYWERWRKRWLKIAEKFKEAK